MSCGPEGCGACGTESDGGCGSLADSEHAPPAQKVVGSLDDVAAVMGTLPLETMINEARQFWKKEDMDIPSKQKLWDQYFNTMAKRLAGDVAANLKPLIEVFETDGPDTFIDVCVALYNYDITGHKICWTSQFVDGNRKLFIDLVQNPTVELGEFIDDQILLFSAVNRPAMQISKIKLPDSAFERRKKRTMDDWKEWMRQYVFAFLLVFVAMLAYRYLNLTK